MMHIQLKIYMMRTKMYCPICNKPLQTWYSACGGQTYIGCSDIKCEYQKNTETTKKSNIDEWLQ